MNRRTVRLSLAGALLALAVAATGCAPGSVLADLAGRGHTTAPAAGTGQRATSRAVVAAQQPVDPAVQSVVERGNQEQVQAIATRNPAVMRDTSTDRYYQELAQTNQDLLDNGVTTISLVRLEWGPVSVTGNTATATTYETWRTTFADGTTDESRDRNVYALVRNGNTWRIDADQHPDDGQAASPPPGGRLAPAPSVPSRPGAAQPGAAQPGTPLPVAAPGRNTSTNWSGYAATGGTFTAVTGTWTVPQASAAGNAGASAAWVGIGGMGSRDLIQAGTQEVVSSSGRVSYQSWIELLPQASQTVPLAVSPGDSVTVSITQQPGDSWLISLTNETTGKRYQQNVQYASSLSSAEWIEEAPSVGRRGTVPLDDFGTIHFSNGSALENGRTVTIAQTGARAIRMVGADGQVLATPSTLGPDGASFSVDRSGSVSAAGSGQGGVSSGSGQRGSPGAQGGQSGRGSQGSQGNQGSQGGQGRPRGGSVPSIGRPGLGF